MKLYTLGHGNRSLDELVALKAETGIRGLVDVRSQPGSKRFPWFNKGSLERALEQAGIGYAWEGEALGGRRPATAALLEVEAKRPSGEVVRFKAIARVDDPVDVDYLRHGGVLGVFVAGVEGAELDGDAVGHHR